MKTNLLTRILKGIIDGLPTPDFGNAKDEESKKWDVPRIITAIITLGVAAALIFRVITIEQVIELLSD